MNTAVQENPFTAVAPAAHGIANVLTTVAAQREVAEVQASMMIAKMNPRDEAGAMDRILMACTRPTLAEEALYEYARGGSAITGPSIRLAECIAQHWGNIDFGIRELEQRPGESTVEAYAWDVQHGTRARKIFQVPHERYTREGGRQVLKDPRDIYETVANQGARRLRACILSIIPGDVVEAAKTQCERTLKTKTEVTPERLANLLTTFAEYGVTKEQIERRIQRRLDAMTPALMVQMGKIYNSLKDGMSKAGDWFETEPAQAAPEGPGAPDAAAPGQPPRTRTAAVRDALAARKRPAAAPASQPAGPPPAAGASGRGGRQSDALTDLIHLAKNAKTEDDLAVARSIAIDQLTSEAEVSIAQEHLNDAAQRLAGGA